MAKARIEHGWRRSAEIAHSFADWKSLTPTYASMAKKRDSLQTDELSRHVVQRTQRQVSGAQVASPRWWQNQGLPSAMLASPQAWQQRTNTCARAARSAPRNGVHEAKDLRRAWLPASLKRSPHFEAGTCQHMPVRLKSSRHTLERRTTRMRMPFRRCPQPSSSRPRCTLHEPPASAADAAMHGQWPSHAVSPQVARRRSLDRYASACRIGIVPL